MLLPRPNPRAIRTTARQARGVASAVALVTAKRTLPVEDGVAEVQGLEAGVEIVRDAHGVPHVFAESAADALFGQGFVHAQDRLFQMDSTRLLAQGRLAEVGGAALLGSDRFMRRLGLAERAAKDFATTGDHERELLRAYARGVNAGIQSLRSLPPEYAVLASAPESWLPEHTLLLGRLVLFTFAGNWDTERLREQLLEALGPERLAELDVAYPAGAHTSTGGSSSSDMAGSAIERMLKAYRTALDAGLPRGGASNAWAVAAERSFTGAPLLAADPHLRMQIPAFFHVCHVAGGDLDAVGAGIPGLPGVFIGHNGMVAWGLTAGMADVSDLYIEEVDPEHPSRYRTPEGWETGSTRVERIEIHGGDTVEEHVIETRHGPVIGPAIPGESRAVALRSTALEDGGDLAAGFLGATFARTPDEFEAAIGMWPGSTFSVVWAYRDGGIGYRLSGSVPQREPGAGLLPSDGATSNGPPPAWPAASMPRLVSPPDGHVISANNAPGSAIEGMELGEEWCERYRAERIVSMLESRARHSRATFREMQLDRYSAALAELRDLLLTADVIDDGRIERRLRTWDGQTAPTSAAAAVLELTYIELARTLVTRVAGRHGSIVLGAGNEGVPFAGSTFSMRLQGRILEALRAPRQPWLSDAGDRDRLLRTAAQRAVATLRERQGREPSGWRWGAVHRQPLRHPLRAIPALGRLSSRGPYELGGDVNTVWQGGFSLLGGPSDPGFAPVYRQVIDLADLDRSTFSVATGASGIPGHPRYDDQVREHLRGRQRPLLYTRDAVERAAEHRLTLVPGGAEV